MSTPHPLGIQAASSAELEKVDPRFHLDGLRRAREKTIAVMHEIRERFTDGMTEDDARRLCLAVFKEHGVTKHWHKPNVRLGPGTALNFNSALLPDYRFKTGDAYYLDLGPVWPDAELGLEYEGDYGDTFVRGENPAVEKCAATARELFTEAREHWRAGATTGEGIYRFLEKRASELGYRLAENVEGHRIADFPHHRYSKMNLAQASFVPAESLWVLEIHLVDPAGKFGAFFEDIL